jgi:hypothetical protein
MSAAGIAPDVPHAKSAWIRDLHPADRGKPHPYDCNQEKSASVSISAELARRAGERRADMTAKTVLQDFYTAVVARDFARARTYLADDLVFEGLFETYRSADHYIATLTGLMQITTRLDIRALVADGADVAVFFELETTAPAAATTLVAEWHRVEGDKIVHARSAFDGRPFAAMFTGGTP